MPAQTVPDAVLVNLLMAWTTSSSDILLLLSPLAIGSAVGLLAIFLALLRHRDSARDAATVAILLGMLSVTIILLPSLHYLLGQRSLLLHPLAYLILAVPIFLGAAARGCCRLYAGTEPCKSGQIPLSAVLFVITIIACGLALFRAWHVPYFQERDRYLAHFQSIPELENVRVLGGDHEGRYYVDTIQFTIKGLPDSFVEIAANRSMIEGLDNDVRILLLFQVGPCRFRNPIPHLGAHGTHTNLIPIEVHSVSDIIERYSDLVTFFKSIEWAATRSALGRSMPSSNRRNER